MLNNEEKRDIYIYYLQKNMYDEKNHCDLFPVYKYENKQMKIIEFFKGFHFHFTHSTGFTG